MQTLEHILPIRMRPGTVAQLGLVKANAPDSHQHDEHGALRLCEGVLCRLSSSPLQRPKGRSKLVANGCAE